MTDWRNPKTSERSIRSFAYKVLRRLHALGARSHTLDDVEQELWVAWCKAIEGYDPERGIAFSTYLHGGMQRYINRYVERHFERFHEQTVAMSLDMELGEEGGSLGDVIADDSAEDAETRAMRESAFNYACSRMSDRARAFVKVLHEQPQELLEEFRRLDAKAQQARDLGLIYNQPSRLTSSMIFDLMEAPRQERTMILKELAQLGEVMTRHA